MMHGARRMARDARRVGEFGAEGTPRLVGLVFGPNQVFNNSIGLENSF